MPFLTKKVCQKIIDQGNKGILYGSNFHSKNFNKWINVNTNVNFLIRILRTIFFLFHFFHGLARPSYKVQDLLASKRGHATRSCRAVLPISLHPSNIQASLLDLHASLLAFKSSCIPSSVPIFLYPF